MPEPSEDRADSYGTLTARRQELWIERRSSIFLYQIDLAKWLFASLLLVNGGSLVALLNSPDRIALVPKAGPWFAAGIAATIASGFFAWVNTGLHVAAYDDLLDPLVAIDPFHFKPFTKLQNAAFALTHWGAIIVGISSLAFSSIGAMQVKDALAEKAPRERALLKPLPISSDRNSLPSCRLAPPLAPCWRTHAPSN